MNVNALDDALAELSLSLEVLDDHGSHGLEFTVYLQEARIALLRARLLLRDLPEAPGAGGRGEAGQ